ncbi:tumor protein D52 isoform X2 [Rana temporaria]|uniref:tumor protein D52 isoform X2 n=1 Tax=Rana temporaria TaxID=8407 RepID=UPI001AAC5E6F|nr:tumor protein D52 isoform X2 [Rana temporaria]
MVRVQAGFGNRGSGRQVNRTGSKKPKVRTGDGSGVREPDLLKPESVPEGEDAAATLKDTLSDEEQEILRRELEKVEEEIQTLNQVLAAKERRLAEIKRKLGVTPLTELKQNISKGLQDVAATNVYRKTSETLSHAGQRASAAISTVGSVITKKLEDVKNSPTFKSFEEKVENLKSKVGGPKQSTGDFEEVLNSAANASATDDLTEKDEENH